MKIPFRRWKSTFGKIGYVATNRRWRRSRKDREWRIDEEQSRLNVETLEPRMMLSGNVAIDTFEDADIGPIDLRQVFDTAQDFDPTYRIVSNSNGGLVDDSLHEWVVALDLADNQNGQAVIEVAADYNDENNNFQTDTAFISLDVTAVNDTPTTVGIPKVVIPEDGEIDVDLTQYFSDIETASANLEYKIHGTPTNFISNSASVYGNPVERIDIVDGIATIKTVPDLFGYAEIPFYAVDDDAGDPRLVAATMWVVVEPVNDAPTGATATSFNHIIDAAPVSGKGHDRSGVFDLRKYFTDAEDLGYLGFSEYTIDMEVTAFNPDQLNQGATAANLIVEWFVNDENDVLLYRVHSGFSGTATVEFEVTGVDREGVQSNPMTITVNIDSNGPTPNNPASCQNCDTLGSGAPTPRIDFNFEVPFVHDNVENQQGAFVTLNNDYTEGNWHVETTYVAQDVYTGDVHNDPNQPDGWGIKVDQLVPTQDDRQDRDLADVIEMDGDDFSNYNWPDYELETDRDNRLASFRLAFGDEFNPVPGDSYTVVVTDVDMNVTFPEAQGMKLWMPLVNAFSKSSSLGSGGAMGRAIEIHNNQDLSHLFGDNLGEMVFGLDGTQMELNVPTHNGSFFMIEGLEEFSGDIKLEATVSYWWVNNVTHEWNQETVTVSETITPNIIQADLDLEHDEGNQVIGTPNVDDRNEDLRGVNIAINARDDDRDGLPDFHDGYDMEQETTNPDLDNEVSPSLAGAGLTPVTLRLSDAVDTDRAVVRFYYDQSDPYDHFQDDPQFEPLIDPVTGVRRTADGGLRIWTKDKFEIRDARGIETEDINGPIAHGDFVADNGPGSIDPSLWDKTGEQGLNLDYLPHLVYTWEELGGVSGENTVTLYLEGVNAGHYRVTVDVDADGLPNQAGPVDPPGGTGIPGEGSGGSPPPGSGTGPATDPEDHDDMLGFGLIDQFIVNVLSEVTVVAPNKYGAEYSRPASGIAATEDRASFMISRGTGNTQGDLRVYYQVQFDDDRQHATDELTVADAADYFAFDEQGNRIQLAQDDNTWVGWVDFSEGESQKPIFLTINQDQVVEWDELVSVRVLSYSEYRTLHRKFNFDGQTVTDPDPENRAIPNDGNDGFRQYYHTAPENHHGEINVQADAVILDDEHLQATRSRNVDGESTGETVHAVTNNQFISADVVDGSITLLLFAGSRVPTYRANDNLQPILTFEAQLPHGEGIPNSLSGALSVAGVSDLSIDFDIANLSGYFSADLPIGETNPFRTVKFVIAGPDDLAEKIPTGSVDYDLELQADFGALETTRTIRGVTEFVNRVNDDFGWDDFGNRWTLDELRRLVASDGITLNGNANQGEVTDRGTPSQRGIASWTGRGGHPKCVCGYPWRQYLRTL